MAEDSRDILMKMTLSADSGGGSPPAECQALISPLDELAQGEGFTYIPKAWGEVTPNYFAIDDFTFKVALKDPTSEAQKQQTTAIKGIADSNKQTNDALKELLKNHPDGKDLLGKLGGAGGGNEYERFIAATPGDRDKVAKSFVGDLSDITISKRMDISSTTLLKACLDREQFTSATVLKRKATGLGELRTYLKIVFNQLMITSFDWSDDDVVKETFQFVCRQAIVTYAVEDYSGKLYSQDPKQWAVKGFIAGS